MDTIIEYELGNMSYEEFHEFMWSSGRNLFQEIGEDMYVFYLNAKQGQFYPEQRKALPTNFDWYD